MLPSKFTKEMENQTNINTTKVNNKFECKVGSTKYIMFCAIAEWFEPGHTTVPLYEYQKKFCKAIHSQGVVVIRVQINVSIIVKYLGIDLSTKVIQKFCKESGN